MSAPAESFSVQAPRSLQMEVNAGDTWQSLSTKSGQEEIRAVTPELRPPDGRPRHYRCRCQMSLFTALTPHWRSLIARCRARGGPWESADEGKLKPPSARFATNYSDVFRRGQHCHWMPESHVHSRRSDLSKEADMMTTSTPTSTAREKRDERGGEFLVQDLMDSLFPGLASSEASLGAWIGMR